MAQFIGRTVASPDALQTYTVFVMNDNGVWLIKRPQDLTRAEIEESYKCAQGHRFADWYSQTRVQIAEHRLDIPREVPFTHPFNKYSANVAGTSYFLPVAELTASYINGLLFAFGEEFGGFWIDDRNWFLPAGIGKFARSRGGHLHDRLKDGRSATLSLVETWLYEVASIEQGGILQNLGLMTQALGLGGFSHFGGHPYGWFQTLGFRMKDVPASQIAGASTPVRAFGKLLGMDMAVPTAVGLERDGKVLIKPYSPPYYRNMEEAVLAFVDFKYAQGTGTLRDDGSMTAWNKGAAVQSQIPRYSDQTIASTIAFCEYVYRRYGRFPATSGPFRTLLAYQAHHLDQDFYDRFYRPEALSASQVEHSVRWHKPS